jgi:hypothetical protein
LTSMDIGSVTEAPISARALRAAFELQRSSV